MNYVNIKKKINTQNQSKTKNINKKFSFFKSFTRKIPLLNSLAEKFDEVRSNCLDDGNSLVVFLLQLLFDKFADISEERELHYIKFLFFLLFYSRYFEIRT